MSSTLYNKKLNLEFYHIPKNGMTTVIHGIGGFKWVEVDTIPEDSKTFCVLRNPTERLVSSFGHFAFSDRFKEVKNHTLRKLPNEAISEFIRLGYTKSGFRKFVSEIKENGIFNGHHRPQVEFLDGTKRKDPKINHRSIDNIDIFCSHQNINQDLKLLTSIDVPHLNKGSMNKKSKSEILDFAFNQVSDDIKEIYSEDFKLYNKYIKQ